MEPKKQNAWKIIVLSTIGILFVAQLLGFNERLQWLLQDQMAIHFRKNSIPDSRVKLILIDDASVNHLSDIVGRYPWPRGIYAPILDFLASGGVKEVYFDILFTEEEESSSSHQTFIDEIGKHPNINFAGLLTKDYPVDATPPQYLSKSIVKFNNFAPIDSSKYQTIYHPIDPIAELANFIPMVTIEPDLDGRYRKIPLYISFQDHWLFNFPLAPFLGDKGQNIVKEDRFININDKRIPITKDGKLICLKDKILYSEIY